MANNAAAAHDASHDEHRPNVRLYIAVFGALLFFTCVTVVISKFHLPRPEAIALGLLVALIKASLVAAIFMHLWGEKKLIYSFIIVTFAFGAMMWVPIFEGYAIRPKLLYPVAVADQHPDEAAAPAPATTDANAAAAPSTTDANAAAAPAAGANP
jgi:caa(3)-type oxidase subunit IV